jgi:hypothetical protein
MQEAMGGPFFTIAGSNPKSMNASKPSLLPLPPRSMPR